MSEARIDRIVNENNTGGPTLSGITTFSGQQYFIPPSGSTAQRPSDCPPGSIRFNTDSAHLEYFDGLQWLEFEASSEELGGGTGSNTGLGTRGVTGGSAGPVTDTIEFITISTLGNSQDFGNLTGSRFAGGACGSRTRGVFMGGGTPTRLSNIDFITFASTGNATNFGSLTVAGSQAAGFSNQTRGIYAGRSSPSGVVNTIDYITIAQTGNAVDFGDLTQAREHNAGCASAVRGISAGGTTPGSTFNIIDYVTISTTGNAQDFGDLLSAVFAHQSGGGSNATRGVFMGGYTPSTTNVINFITIATTGNAQDFGDLTQAKNDLMVVTDSTRAVCLGGQQTPVTLNTIEFITIATTGNGADFGDMITATKSGMSCSNGHGGL